MIPLIYRQSWGKSVYCNQYGQINLRKSAMWPRTFACANGACFSRMHAERAARVAVFFFSQGSFMSPLCIQWIGAISDPGTKKDTLVVKIRVKGQVKVQRVFLFLIFWLKDSKKELTLSISFQLRQCCSI